MSMLCSGLAKPFCDPEVWQLKMGLLTQEGPRFGFSLCIPTLQPALLAQLHYGASMPAARVIPAG